MSGPGTVMDHRTEFHQGCATLRVTGEIDSDSSPRLTTALAMCLESRPRQVTVSLAGATFCDCSGLNALLSAHYQAARRGVPLRVADVKAPMVARLFTLTGTDRTLGLN
ncbi:STAS domain-containing protein [Streptomyces sp. NPDC006326]|uniref:STAS domain-containing protein n=1 Tax=Streptomyces sp. NPDC006326 TaxID=3156752 RepID=UPI0033A16FFD